MAAAVKEALLRLLRLLAAKTVENEDSRNMIIAAVLTPVIFIVIIAGFITYVLEHPIEALIEMNFSDNEISWITELQESFFTTSIEVDGVTVTYGKPEQSEKAAYSTRFYKSKLSNATINKNSPFASWSITSKTGKRKTGIIGASTNHAGVDRGVPKNTPITLPIDVTFVSSGYNSSRGKWIKLKDENSYILQFQHLNGYGDSFHTGDVIPAGSVICYSGNTGVGSYHLHEEYYTPDGATNISESYWAEFSPIS